MWCCRVTAARQVAIADSRVRSALTHQACEVQYFMCRGCGLVAVWNCVTLSVTCPCDVCWMGQVGMSGGRLAAVAGLGHGTLALHFATSSCSLHFHVEGEPLPFRTIQ